MKRSDITDEQVVDACRQFHATKHGHGAQKLPSETLMEATGAPLKVVMAAMERACKRGLIEYGVSLRTAWPVNP